MRIGCDPRVCRRVPAQGRNPPHRDHSRARNHAFAGYRCRAVNSPASRNGYPLFSKGRRYQVVPWPDHLKPKADHPTCVFPTSQLHPRGRPRWQEPLRPCVRTFSVTLPSHSKPSTLSSCIFAFSRLLTLCESLSKSKTSFSTFLLLTVLTRLTGP